MELRGYDHYEVTLGDEVRGQRASMGKTLDDVERDLHIRAPLILAIENCDVSGIANPGLLPGYVRSYAKYLGADAETFYARFCSESGFVPPNRALGGKPAEGGGPVSHGKRLEGSPFDKSRFAVAPSQTRFSARVSLGSVVSGLALLALVGGLGYGGHALLQNLQRVGFAPLPDAPDIVAVAPEIAARETDSGSAPLAAAYAADGALAGVYAPLDQPPATRRDGPISAIDPEAYGIYAGPGSPVAPRIAEAEPDAPATTPRIDSADDAIAAAAAREARVAAAQDLMAERLARLKATRAAEPDPEPPAAAPKGTVIVTSGRAWIRVRNADSAVLKEGILEAGERYALPDRVARGTLRAGNAGAVYVEVDGVVHGPLGTPGEVVKNVSLAGPDVRTAYAEVDRSTLQLAEGDGSGAERAAAD